MLPSHLFYGYKCMKNPAVCLWTLHLGLLYTHTRINDNTKKTLEAASFLYALIELLHEKGLISIEELDERKRQDVEEGIIRWNFGRPYLIAHDADSYCVHLNRDTNLCSVHQHRPVPCCGFDCKNNEKWQVWQDYEKKILNPELMEKIDLDNSKIYSIHSSDKNPNK